MFKEQHLTVCLNVLFLNNIYLGHLYICYSNFVVLAFFVIHVL